MRPKILAALALATALASLVQQPHAQDPPAKAQPTLMELREFARPGQPFRPVEPRPALRELDDDELLRVLDRSRRELRNFALRRQLQGRVPPRVLERLETNYHLTPHPFPDGFEVEDPEDVTLLMVEAMSLAIERDLALDTCELQPIYDSPPDEPDPVLPHVLESEKDILEAATAIVAIVDKDVIADTTGGYVLDVSRFDSISDFPLCDFSPLFGLPRASIYGTGFLIEGDRIVTAGHVANSSDFRERARFVFGYTMPEPGGVKRIFAEDEVFLAADDPMIVYDEDRRDFAVIELKSSPPAEKFTPLALRTEGKVGDEERVYTIGHPLGLPQMYTGPKPIYENGLCIHFLSALDTYRYHSGSPVINAKTGLVEGVLIWRDKEIREYCSCRAPEGMGAEHGFSIAWANRSRMVAEALALPDSIVVVNETGVAALVETEMVHAIDALSTRRIPYAETMVLLQLPTESDLAAGDFFDCKISYDPIPGETWTIAHGDDTETLVMMRCPDEAPVDTPIETP